MDDKVTIWYKMSTGSEPSETWYLTEPEYPPLNNGYDTGIGKMEVSKESPIYKQLLK